VPKEIKPPAVRVRRTNRQLFLDKLKTLSGDDQKLINNRSLRTALNWEEELYTRTKEELVLQGSIIAGRGGPGGAVSLAAISGEKSPAPLNVFISYSHLDEQIKDELVKHLLPLQRMALIAGWHDRKIQPGDKWEGVITKNLNSADIYILLISIDFINSKYCYDIEMDKALEREAAGNAIIIPVIVRGCMWRSTPFRHFQALPIDGKAISTFPDRDEALSSVAEGVRVVAERLISKR